MQSRLLFARTGHVRPAALWTCIFRRGQLRRRIALQKGVQTSSRSQVAAVQHQCAFQEDVVSERHGGPHKPDKGTTYGSSKVYLDETSARYLRRRPSSSLPDKASASSDSTSNNIRHVQDNTTDAIRGKAKLSDRRHTISKTKQTVENEDLLRHTLRVVQVAQNEVLARAEARRNNSMQAAWIEDDQNVGSLEKLLPVSKAEFDSISRILNASTGEEAAQRFLSTECVESRYVMSEILQRDGIKTKSFRSLVVYCWHNFTKPPSSPDLPSSFEENLFLVIICRLLDRARKLLAPAVISIAYLMVEYFSELAARSPMLDDKLHPRLHTRLSDHYNLIINRLSLPASIHPFKSMAYNWTAQRVLLESANRFQPPLELNRTTYRSVSTVLLAMKKSPHEEKFSSLLESSWPPWRREQDGMDADRPANADLSRVNKAMARMTEAGYPDEPIDRAIKILGGRETDGTPTIHTRYLLKVQTKPGDQLAIKLLRKVMTKSSLEPQVRPSDLIRYYPTKIPVPGPSPSPNAAEWTARIEATRNVQEAWAAFSSFPQESGHRSLEMYFAMTKKLYYDELLSMRGQLGSLIPGNGPEVFPVTEDNLSDDMKLRLKPPHRDELYARMIGEGHILRGRFLNFLLQNARTYSHAIRYLHDSNLQPLDVERLINPACSSTSNPLSNYETIPEPVFTAFIFFLSHPSYRDRNETARNPTHLQLERDPFGHALHLLECQERVRRPAWNAFFKGIARQGVAIDPNQDLMWNDKASWALFLRSYQKFEGRGLELDHEGFLFMCRCLEKALLAQTESFTVLEDKMSTDRGRHLLKTLFRNMGERLKEDFHLPKLAFKLGGTQVHAYIRVVGLSQDINELRYVTQWIVDNSDCLLEEADQSPNGRMRLRRAIIAIRVFTDLVIDEAPEVVASIRALVDTLAKWHAWGGWASDEEAFRYRQAWQDLEEGKDGSLYRTWHRMGFIPKENLRAKLRRENRRLVENRDAWEGYEYAKQKNDD